MEDLDGLIRRQLGKFEAILDINHCRKCERTCMDVYEFRKVGELPYIIWDSSVAPDTDWEEFPYNDAFDNPSKMLLNELRLPYFRHQHKDFSAINIRANYGTVILPSIFGIGYRKLETSMPASMHLDSRAEVEKLIQKGKPDSRNGLGKNCFDTAAYYMKVLSDYPKLKKTVRIYHPDLQGPFDVGHLIWGSDIFMAMYDCPELVHGLLSLVTETYIGWMKKWKEFVGEGNEFTSHWEYYLKGGAMIRNDTSVMLSSRHYEEFVKPYDQKILDEFGGGFHYCGKGDNFIEPMCACKNLHAINCTQPELNNVNKLIELTQSNRITLMGLHEKYIPENIKTGIIKIITTETRKIF